MYSTVILDLILKSQRPFIWTSYLRRHRIMWYLLYYWISIVYFNTSSYDPQIDGFGVYKDYINNYKSSQETFLKCRSNSLFDGIVQKVCCLNLITFRTVRNNKNLF